MRGPRPHLVSMNGRPKVSTPPRPPHKSSLGDSPCLLVPRLARGIFPFPIISPGSFPLLGDPIRHSKGLLEPCSNVARHLCRIFMFISCPLSAQSGYLSWSGPWLFLSFQLSTPRLAPIARALAFVLSFALSSSFPSNPL